MVSTDAVVSALRTSPAVPKCKNFQTPTWFEFFKTELRELGCHLSHRWARYLSSRLWHTFAFCKGKAASPNCPATLYVGRHCSAARHDVLNVTWCRVREDLLVPIFPAMLPAGRSTRFAWLYKILPTIRMVARSGQ